MASAWIFQDPKQVEKKGEAKASWYVGWFDPEGKKRCKSCGPGAAGKSNAEKVKKKVEAELLTGTYQSALNKTWKEFRQEYEKTFLPKLAPRSRPEVLTALDHFERLVHPVKVSAIKTSTIDDFAAKRRKEKGKKKGDRVSPATVNKDLRHVRAALRKAKKLDYIATLPYFDMEKVPKKLATYIIPEHFAVIYKACETATKPHDQPYPAADWWRALMVFAYMTGWRISDMLGLRRDDLDLEAATAITRAEDNKGDRDDRVKLHPTVVEHLRKLPAFDPRVFPWNHDRTTLDNEFADIQRAAGINLPCRGKHEHTPFCHVYGFHDLRRAFATMNASRLTPDALQALMRHKSYTTTQVYINIGRQLDDAVDTLHVPEFLRNSSMEGHWRDNPKPATSDLP
jgi:integrase